MHSHQGDFLMTELRINDQLKELIVNCIISNSDVRMEANDKTMLYEPEGQAMECGMIKFLIDNEIDVN